jgi:hypothetical protein
VSIYNRAQLTINVSLVAKVIKFPPLTLTYAMILFVKLYLIMLLFQESLLDSINIQLMLKIASVAYLGGTKNKRSFQPLLY